MKLNENGLSVLLLKYYYSVGKNHTKKEEVIKTDLQNISLCKYFWLHNYVLFLWLPIRIVKEIAAIIFGFEKREDRDWREDEFIFVKKKQFIIAVFLTWIFLIYSSLIFDSNLIFVFSTYQIQIS